MKTGLKVQQYGLENIQVTLDVLQCGDPVNKA